MDTKNPLLLALVVIVDGNTENVGNPRRDKLTWIDSSFVGGGKLAMRKTLLLALMVLGCGDPFFGGSNEPIAPLSVTLSYSITDSMYHHDSQRWECKYTLTAEATGGPDEDFAIWETSLRRQRPGPEWVLSPLMLQDLWGNDRIRTGETLTSTQETHGPSGIAQGFLLEWTFRFGMSDGSHQSETLHVDCRG